MMLLHTYAHVIPAAFALLPPSMRSNPATAMLLAIGMQESRFAHRRQRPAGPARGFWQFERGGGVHGVLTHPASATHARHVLDKLRYHDADEGQVYHALEHNDVLACAFARLLLWTAPKPLPSNPHVPEPGWAYYLNLWRPGKPHPQTWAGCYGVAWDLVQHGVPEP
jgi:hypothetical protein